MHAKHKTGLIFFPAFDWAISETHPEREERLLYTQDQVLEEGVLDIEGITEFKADVVDVKDVQRIHFCAPDEQSVMTESHFISAGGAKTIAQAIMNKKINLEIRLQNNKKRYSELNTELQKLNDNKKKTLSYIRNDINTVSKLNKDKHYKKITENISAHTKN